MPVQIKWPTSGRRIDTPNGAFLAWGRADDTIVDVSGTCRSVAQPSIVSEGRTIYYSPCRRSCPERRYRWGILFRVPEAGEYRLTVVGEADDGTTSSSSLVLTVKFVYAITIGWPDPNEDITAYADDFTPYGYLTQNPLGAVTLKDTSPNQNSVALLYSYGDYTDYQVWTAQFATVPAVVSPVTYTLNAQDSTGASAQSPGLIVTS
jgi:hypothetical protein